MVGSINVDHVIRTATLPSAGETVLGRSHSLAHGGKGANQAVAAAYCGAPSAMIGAVGADSNGSASIEQLQGASVDTSAVAVVGEASTGLAFVTVDDEGANQIIVIPGANSALSPEHVSRHLELLAARAERPPIVVVSLEIPGDAVDTAISDAKRLDCTVILNPAPYQDLGARLVSLVDIITPNETELAAFLGSDLPSETPEVLLGYLDRANRLQPHQHLVATLGAYGAVLIGQGIAMHSPSPPVDPVDTTGSGDVFNGALAAALTADMPIADAVGRAVATATAAVATPGARMSPPQTAT